MTDHPSPANAVCYVERSAVRQILIGSNVNNEDTKDLLQEVDTLPIVTADDFRIRAQPAASPANETPQGHTESEGYAASLRQQADLMEKANAGKVSAYVAIDDFDVDELRDAADFIERIRAEPAASPVNAGWTPDQFWEYVGGLAGEFEAGQMRDMMMSHGLSLGIRAQCVPSDLLEAAKSLIDEISTRGTHERWKRLDNALSAFTSPEYKSAPAVNGSLPSGESDPAVTLDFAGAGTAAQPQCAWQPINTAPRDGTIVDLRLTGGGRITDQWWDDDDKSWCGIRDEAFTHWAPVPDDSTLTRPECGAK